MISSHPESVKCHFKYLMIDFIYYIVQILNDRFCVYYNLIVLYTILFFLMENYIKNNLYILVYFDGGHPKFFCRAPPPTIITLNCNKKDNHQIRQL